MVGELEAADPLGDRPGERPLLVPEQLAFKQACRNRGAVALDERVRAPGAQMVHRARNELFARARLAADQDGRLGRRDQLDLIDEVAQRAAAADDALVDHVCRTHIGERQRGDLGARARGRNERDDERFQSIRFGETDCVRTHDPPPRLSPPLLSQLERTTVSKHCEGGACCEQP